MTVPPAETSAPDAEKALLRIMATTDLHCHVLPYDYYHDRPDAAHGLSQLAHQIDRLRAETPNCLLLDNGDFLQGNPLGDYVAEVRGLGQGNVHPMIAAMNALRYDGATLGNHEFNYGLAFLAKAITAADFPVVSANALTSPGTDALQDQWLQPPYVILDRTILTASGRPRPIRVGLIGFLPPQITIWDRDHLQSRIFTRDIVAAAQALVPAMKAKGADIIIALCHSGIDLAASLPGQENAALPLAATPGIDAVIAGHSHMVFPSPAFAGRVGVDAAAGTLFGKPAVMAGCFASHLGLIDLDLHFAEGSWTVTSAKTRALPTVIDETPNASARAVATAVQHDHDATLAHVRRPVGRSHHALHSYFGVLPGNRALRLVADAQRRHIEAALRRTPLAALPLLSAVAPFKMGGRGGPDHYTDVPAGELLLHHVSDLYVHPNTICAVLIDGAQLLAWLERSASVFNHLHPDAPDQALLHPEAPSTSFDVIHGIRYAIDLSAPPRHGPHGDLVDRATARIRDLTHDGRPVGPGDRFIVATNNHRAYGGSSFPGADGSTLIHAEPTLTRDILLRHVESQSPIELDETAGWRFRPLPGTIAIYDTSAKSAPHAESILGLRIEPLSHPDPAFARYRLHF